MVNQKDDLKPVDINLSTSEIELHALFAAMDNFVFVFDKRGHHLKTVATNPTLLHYLSPEQRAEAFHKFVPPTHEQPLLDYIQHALKFRQTVTTEYCLLVDGIHVFFEASLSPIQENSVIWVAHDITERRWAELCLKESEERFRNCFTLPLVGIAITSPEKGWLEVNDKTCEMLGYSREELAQLTWAELTHPEDLVFDLELFEQLLSGEIDQYSMDKRYLRKDGEIIYSYLGVGAVRKADGSLDYVVALMQDITKRKKAEEALRRSEEELRAKAEQLEQALRSLQQTQAQLIQTEKMSSLGQLVAGIAHEINNPVSFIYSNIPHVGSYIEDLLNLLGLYQRTFGSTPTIQTEATAIDLDFIVEDLPKALSSMEIGADRIHQIVLSLRSFSRLDESEMKSVDIHEGLDNTLLILQNRLRARAQGADIQVIKQYGNLPAVECYPGQLNQVFMNILANAIDALEESVSHSANDALEWGVGSGEWRMGKQKEHSLACTDAIKSPVDTLRERGSSALPTPTITICTELADSSTVAIRIADNGLGMTEKTRQRLFEPFFTTKPIGKGTGLGLSISYQIVVDKHRGQLECMSVLGQGTEFTVKLPIRQRPLESVQLA